MEDTCTCPKCHMENAYFNGVIFVCPDCDYEWSNQSAFISNNDSIKDTFNESAYDILTELKQPFFKLEHGKLYDCIVETKEGIENISIIPLAFKKGKNQQFIMTDARRLFKKNPSFVHEIIKMGFDYIRNDGISDYPHEYDGSKAICATQKDGSLLDSLGMRYYDFKKTNEI